MCRSTKCILLAGGQEDPNILCLLDAAKRNSVEHRALLVGEDIQPAFSWDIQSDRLLLDREPIELEGLFLRYDVFAALKDGRAASQLRAQRWYTAALAYAVAHDSVRMLNRSSSPYIGNKPATLLLASQSGLRIPRSLISNDLEAIRQMGDQQGLIAKPIDGGDLCRHLSDVMRDLPQKDGRTASPAIVQSRLSQPEVRIYRIKDCLIAFNMQTESLDYREKQDVRVSLLPSAPGEEAEGLVRLMDSMGLDFGAADFKTDPETGRLCFLEVNSSPMFSHFNYASGDRLANMILSALR